jgi:hypothetical protein
MLTIHQPGASGCGTLRQPSPTAPARRRKGTGLELSHGYDGPKNPYTPDDSGHDGPSSGYKPKKNPYDGPGLGYDKSDAQPPSSRDRRDESEGNPRRSVSGR